MISIGQKLAVFLLVPGILGVERSEVVRRVVVEVGPNGTDNDVMLKLCSGFDCCVTPALKAWWSNDWSRNDREVWKAKYLGDCKNFEVVDRELSATLIRDGDDGLLVDALFVETRSTSSRFGFGSTFSCGSFDLTDPTVQAKNRCGFGINRGGFLDAENEDEGDAGLEKEVPGKHKSEKEGNSLEN